MIRKLSILVLAILFAGCANIQSSFTKFEGTVNTVAGDVSQASASTIAVAKDVIVGATVVAGAAAGIQSATAVSATPPTAAAGATNP